MRDGDTAVSAFQLATPRDFKSTASKLHDAKYYVGITPMYLVPGILDDAVDFTHRVISGTIIAANYVQREWFAASAVVIANIRSKSKASRTYDILIFTFFPSFFLLVLL